MFTSDPPVTPLLLTRAQAAQALALSVDVVDQLIKRDELAAIRIGRAVRISADALRDFVARRQQQTTGAAR